MTLRYMRYLATGLITLLLPLPALSVELFRYRGAAKDGGTLEYVFDAGEQNSPDAVTKEKAAEIAADFMTTFYHVQVGALETLEFRTMPVLFWLICFSDTIKGALRQFYFVVLLPDGTVVEPTVAGARRRQGTRQTVLAWLRQPVGTKPVGSPRQASGAAPNRFNGRTGP